jgi:broad specificity phosphatase PhoE
MTYYGQGVEAGRTARREADAQYSGPTIGPDPGGESWEDYRRRWEELLEPIFHEHMPHTEVEIEIPPPPPINVVR